MATRKQLYKMAKQSKNASGKCVGLSRMKKAELQKYINGIHKNGVKKAVIAKPKTIKIKIKKPVVKKPVVKKPVVKKPVVKKSNQFKALITAKKNIAKTKSEKTNIKRTFKGRKTDLTTQGDFLRLYKKLNIIFKPLLNDKYGDEEDDNKAIKFFNRTFITIKKSKKIIYARYVDENDSGLPSQVIDFSWFSDENLMSYLKTNKMTKPEFKTYLINATKAIKDLIDDEEKTIKLYGARDEGNQILDFGNFDKAEGMYNLLKNFINRYL